MSPAAALASVAFAAFNLFAAGIALHSTLADGLGQSAGIAAERVVSSAAGPR